MRDDVNCVKHAQARWLPPTSIPFLGKTTLTYASRTELPEIRVERCFCSSIVMNSGEICVQAAGRLFSRRRTTDFERYAHVLCAQ